jgi:membrane-associated protein
MITLCIAGILGNQCNYFIGKWIGPRVFKLPRSRWFNPAHLDKAHQFYRRHGALAIVLSRFFPIIRTLAPFVAGIARMNLKRFACFNALGCFIWAIPLLSIGYAFGNLPAVKEHFSLLIVFIVLIFLLPAAIAYLKNSKRKHRPNQQRDS